MRNFSFLRLLAFGFILFSPVLAVSQTQEERVLRGSIPEELLRPNRSEASRYPIDMVIGELGQGSVSSSAFNFANDICTGFLSGNTGYRTLASVNSAVKESLMSSLHVVNPLSYRIGGGREEADGAFSFLVRFIGKEQGITGELYVRYVTKRTEKEIEVEVEVEVEADDEAEIEAETGLEDGAETVNVKKEKRIEIEVITSNYWAFEDLILEEAKSREIETRESIYRYDFYPYERFF